MEKDYRFDTFLMEKWADSDKKDLAQRQQSARKNLQKALKGSNAAASATIRAWCGIGKRTQPGRDKMFQLAFALHMAPVELEEYLKSGLGMPGVQINDYRELIYYYGLEHEMTIQQCDEMILVFEKHLNSELELQQDAHTERLWEYYASWRRMDSTHFLKEMCSHAEMFKGYSKTALDYFVQLKSELTEFIQKDIREDMKRDLKKLGYQEWQEKESIDDGEEKEEILRFLKNTGRQANVRGNAEKQELICSIRHDCSILYAGHERNRDILRELYAPVMERRSGKNILYKKNSSLRQEYRMKYMSEKRISDLLAVALQKERQIQIAQRLAEMEEGDEKRKLEKEYCRQGKRCLLLQREDLLPLLLEVSRRKYQQEIEMQGKRAEPDEARERFCNMANTVLADCSMIELNEKYAFDRMLLESFQAKDVDGFADIIDSGPVMNEKRLRPE